MLALRVVLTTLHIRDFAIIHEVSLTLEPGLTVLTGETGAGKSILVDALELVLGGRGDASLVRHGAERAEISAGFDLQKRPGAREWLTGQALDDGDGECHLRRVLQADGRSRGFINGRPAPMQSLAALGERLVEIHGQHEHQSLLHRDQQRRLLDDYGGHAAELEAVRHACAVCRDLEQRLQQLPGGGEERERQAEYLRHQVRELEQLGLGREEIAELEGEQRRLAHARELIEACSRALEGLDGDAAPSAMALLGSARHDLEAMAGFDERLREPLDLLEGATIQMREGADALAHYLSGVDLDPEQLASVEQRLGQAHDLARKHRVSMEALPDRLEALHAELEELESAETRGRELAEELGRTRDAYGRAAATLGKRRRTAAKRLSEAVTGLMESLGMKDGRFEVEVSSDPETIASSGTDVVTFHVSANPGQPPGPLRKVASGGELSRIALAVQVAAVDVGGDRTLIFDEVDAGVGGAVAEIVGQKLRRLGAAGQALCVTHLPQVAAQGHHHLWVEKSARDGGVRTAVTVLDDDSRTREIARMLGGVRITAKTTEHAREMLGRSRD